MDKVKKPVALQLYTVRDLCGKDQFASTMKQVAKIGYSGVEVGGPPEGMKYSEMAAIIRNEGMTITSIHYRMPDRGNASSIVSLAGVLGINRVISGFRNNELKTMEDCKVAAGKVNQAVDVLSPCGLQFGLHNHFWEFEPINGEYPLDILLRFCPGVFSQLDIFWSAFVGADTAGFLQRHKSRVPLLHVKDGIVGGGKPGETKFVAGRDGVIVPDFVAAAEGVRSGSYQPTWTPVGEGNVDVLGLIARADSKVLDWLIVEQDSCQGNSLDAARKSYDYLTRHGVAAGRYGEPV